MLAVIITGAFLMLLGELGFEWAPAISFLTLRVYLVSAGYMVRQKLGNRGVKITRFWTWSALILGALYIASLHYANHFGGTSQISFDSMIGLEAANIMIVGVEIYFALSIPEHPAELRAREIEANSEILELEVSRNRDQIEVLELQIGERDSKIEALKKQIGEVELQAEFNSNELSKQIERLRLVEKRQSEAILNATTVVRFSNVEARACPDCGVVSIWGIAKKGEVCCDGCGGVVRSAG